MLDQVRWRQRMAIKERTITIKDLEKAGVPVVSAKDYIPKNLIKDPAVSLERVQKILAKIPTSLAETISQLRDQSL